MAERERVKSMKEIKTQINKTRTMKEVAEWATLPAIDAPVVTAEAGTPRGLGPGPRQRPAL